MTADEFSNQTNGMTEAQRCAAFDYLTGALSVPVGRYHTRSQTIDIEDIEEMFTNACNHGRATRK